MYIFLNFFFFCTQGHTAFDLAEKDMHKLLEELKETQASVSSNAAITRAAIFFFTLHFLSLSLSFYS